MKESTKIRDNFQSPTYAIQPLIPYVPDDWTVWECCQGQGNLVKALSMAGYNVFGSDIREGVDFLTCQPLNYNCIITNPPWSLRNQFLKRAYEIEKPFAFLLPLVTLDTGKRQSMFRDYGIELILMDKRIEYMGRNGLWKASRTVSAWFTHGFNIGQQLTFVKIEKPTEVRYC